MTFVELTPVLGDPVNWVDVEGLASVGWIVKLTKTGFKKVVALWSEAAARTVRRQGENVLMSSRQAAKAVARGTLPDECQNILRHKGHET